MGWGRVPHTGVPKIVTRRIPSHTWLVSLARDALLTSGFWFKPLPQD